MKKVSVVIPCYNVSTCLGWCYVEQDASGNIRYGVYNRKYHLFQQECAAVSGEELNMHSEHGIRLSYPSISLTLCRNVCFFATLSCPLLAMAMRSSSWVR